RRLFNGSEVGTLRQQGCRLRRWRRGRRRNRVGRYTALRNLRTAVTLPVVLEDELPQDRLELRALVGAQSVLDLVEEDCELLVAVSGRSFSRHSPGPQNRRQN